MRLRQPIRFKTFRLICGALFMLAAKAAPALAAGDEGAPAPEIDPGSVAGAMTLPGGGLLMLTDRVRAKQQ